MAKTKHSELIQILAVSEVTHVQKPWGWERWIADGKPTFPYVLKEIFLKAGARSSLQFHQKKQETSYIQKGRGILYYSTEPIDAVRYLKGGYSKKELDEVLAQLKTKELTQGYVYHISPGIIHRLEAVDDITLVESSTVELDDVIRIADDSGRSHGRVDGEHKAG